ncbi:hypothetical protein RBI22_15145 [Alcaligenaceae bacterium C4P045]|nr:hypothetical protein [Alcaligenaceae bacterium C4P045]
MSQLSRLKFDRFCVMNRPFLAALGKVLSGSFLAIMGGVAGYSIGRIETTHLLQTQAARHVQEILSVRDTYGTKAQDARDSIRQAAEATSKSADAVEKIASQIGGPAVSAKKQAVRATQAAEKAQEAADRIEQIFPDGYRPDVQPLPNRDPRVVPGEVPAWLDTP